MNIDTPFAQVALRSINSDAKKFLSIAAAHLDDIEQLDHVAYLQSVIKDFEGCIKTLEKELKLANGNVQLLYLIRSNLATIYNKTNDPLSAIELLNLNLELNSSEELLMEKALSFYFLGKYEESEKIMRMLLEDKRLSEQYRDRVEYNLSIYDIENNKFKEGFRKYVEKGHRINIWPTQQRVMIPQWNGEVEQGKTILIHGEGGIGDEIIGVRFMNHIKKLGMNPVWHTNNADLEKVFNRNGYQTILDYEQIDSDNVAQCMAMYLPIILNLNEDELWTESYLTPCEEHVKKWKEILPKNERKLAVRWQGNTNYEQDLHRSIPVEYMKDLVYDGIKINLQIDQKVDWAFNPEIKSIEDTLAILSLCEDGVISSCTSVAHMSASMNLKRTIVCPPIAYYYVWSKNLNWYDINNVYVMRQTEWKNWKSVFDKVQSLITS